MLLVTNRIRSETNVSTKNLATVILVSQLKQVDSTSPQSIAVLREELERWNEIWGLLLQDNDFLTMVIPYIIYFRMMRLIQKCWICGLKS